MSDSVSISVDSVALDARLMKLASRLANPRPMLDRIGDAGKREILLNFRKGGSAQGTWAKPLFRSGKALNDQGILRDSVGYSVGDMDVHLGSNNKYGPIMHKGGVIRAKNVKFLPVPLHEKAARAQRSVKSVRDIPKLELIPRKDKPALLVKFIGRRTKSGGYAKGSRMEPWFILKKSVTIGPRPWLVLPNDFGSKANAIVRAEVEKA